MVQFFISCGKTRFPLIPLTFLVAFLLESTTVVSAESPPNIVLILADDLGYGDPVCYNENSRCVTPNLDQLAKDGMLFSDAHAAGGVCHPSRYGLLTGRYPFRHNRQWQQEPMILAEEMTVPQLLTNAGYSTAMIGKWHLGFDKGPDYNWEAGLTGGPVDRGFASYFGMPASLDIPPYYFIRNRTPSPRPTVPIEASSSPDWSPIQGKFWRAGLRAENFIMEEILDRFADEAVKVISNQFVSAESPQFLYLALPAPHTPWLPAEPYRGIGKAGIYGEFVAHVDAVVGRVLEALQQNGQAENTLVIFTSDNGPCWYDEDEARFNHFSAGPLKGMKGDTWEGGHRVPFLVRWPNHVPAGSRSDTLVGFIDLLPTLSELLKSPIPTDQLLDGRSFASLLSPEPVSPWGEADRIMLQHHSGNVIRKGPWKLITQLGSGGFSPPRKVNPEPGGPRGQLYRLDRDLGETTNLWNSQPEMVTQLQQLRDKLLQKPDPELIGK